VPVPGRPSIPYTQGSTSPGSPSIREGRPRLQHHDQALGRQRVAKEGRHPTRKADPEARSIMERIHGGDRSAMDELLQTYWAPLVSYAQQIVRSRDTAEDVVQEVALRIWERRNEWTPTDRLQAFLYRTTRNEALNQRRGRRTRDRILGSLPLLRRTGPSPEEISRDSDLSRSVRRAIDSLPPRRREIFILARFHGQSHREIAEILDISPQTVSNQMSSALSQLRGDLREVYRELDRGT
jgi:RNA polymerase sigma-70 factor, ECF subfamily